MLHHLSYARVCRLLGCWMPTPAINAPPITPAQLPYCYARVNHNHIDWRGKAVEPGGGNGPPRFRGIVYSYPVHFCIRSTRHINARLSGLSSVFPLCQLDILPCVKRLEPGDGIEPPSTSLYPELSRRIDARLSGLSPIQE